MGKVADTFSVIGSLATAAAVVLAWIQISQGVKDARTGKTSELLAEALKVEHEYETVPNPIDVLVFWNRLYIFKKNKAADADVVENIESSLLGFMRRETKIREFWDKTKPHYSSEFVKYVDAKLAQPVPAIPSAKP